MVARLWQEFGDALSRPAVSRAQLGTAAPCWPGCPVAAWLLGHGVGNLGHIADLGAMLLAFSLGITLSLAIWDADLGEEMKTTGGQAVNLFPSLSPTSQQGAMAQYLACQQLPCNSEAWSWSRECHQGG